MYTKDDVIAAVTEMARNAQLELLNAKDNAEAQRADANYWKREVDRFQNEVMSFQTERDRLNSQIRALENELFALKVSTIDLPALLAEMPGEDSPFGIGKIPLIKFVREKYGFYLVEAKNLVDNWVMSGQIVEEGGRWVVVPSVEDLHLADDFEPNPFLEDQYDTDIGVDLPDHAGEGI